MRCTALNDFDVLDPQRDRLSGASKTRRRSAGLLAGERRCRRSRGAEIPVLVLTTFDDDANLFGALRAGAAGYLLKDVSSETLISAIQAATRGESFLQSTVTGRVVAAFARLMESGGPKAEALVLPLSARERDILTLLGTGASNKEIADRLCLAEGTVKNHVTNILTKLDVRDRTQAAIRARQLGIV